MNNHKPKEHPEEEKFSVTLEKWLKSDTDKTVSGLSEVFAEKSFAIKFLILMAFPALPIPTAGLSHVFEVITMLLALEMLAQRKTIWLPSRWRHKHLGKSMVEKGLPKLIKIITKVEKLSKPRMSYIIDSRAGTSVLGTIIFLITLDAFVFSFIPTGLDTLPSIGVIFISLGIIFGDILFIIFGSIVGTTGVMLSLLLGQKAIDFIMGLF